MVEFLFKDIANDEVLEEIPSKRIARNLVFRLEPQKAGGQSRLGEVQLGRFREALADIGVVGLKAFLEVLVLFLLEIFLLFQ